MSLYKKITILVLLLMVLGLGLTLSVVYVESRSIIITSSENKAQSIIATVTAAMDANISSTDFQKILENLHKRESFIKTFDIFETNGDGYIIASTNVQHIGTQVSKQVQSDATKAEFTTIVQGNNVVIGAPIDVNGRMAYYTDVTISLGQDLLATKSLLSQTMLTGLAAVVLMAIALWLMISRLVSRPLLVLIKQTKRIADGVFDIGLTSSVDRKDEIGQLIRAFHSMATSLQTLVDGIASASSELSAASQQLVASSDETALGANEVVHVIGQVSSRMTRQLSKSQESADAMSFVANEIDSIVKTTMEAVDASNQSMKKAQEGSITLENIASQMVAINQTTGKTLEANEQLLIRSQQIEAITGQINEIARRTNLLALNASIEAVRAGEHGRGFGVVASEVTMLADHTKDLVDQISKVVRQVQVDIRNTMKLATEANNSVESGLQTIIQTTDVFQGIATLTGSVANQITSCATSMERISDHSRQVKVALHDMTETTNTSSTEISDVREYAHHQLSTVEEIHGFANHLRDMALDLQKVVATFTPNQS